MFKTVIKYFQHTSEWTVISKYSSKQAHSMTHNYRSTQTADIFHPASLAWQTVSLAWPVLFLSAWPVIVQLRTNDRANPIWQDQ